jgi:hypothetical protein
MLAPVAISVCGREKRHRTDTALEGRDAARTAKPRTPAPTA